ncbi:CRISPR-associated endonuclease Cas2 [Corynebacterium sp. 35RC1]|nr:CRISPR-associated endonuclease Cas2 [Corynebacterium sp. 35RC1]
MFDLPVTSKKARREATQFRNHLLDLGFAMAQLSVYVQYLPLSARVSILAKSIKANLPAGGCRFGVVGTVCPRSWYRGSTYLVPQRCFLP